jgi:bacteriorhodopsin
MAAAQVANAQVLGEDAPLGILPGIQSPTHMTGVLRDDDPVGATFFIACNMMLAFTGFFFVQVGQVKQQWKTSVSIAGLVTGIAWYNYTFMKDQWVHTGNTPTTYRYVDWLITVPLQIVEFYFILKASSAGVPGNLGMRLLLSSIAMVGFGFLAENDIMAKTVGFMLGCMCWLYIVYETFSGEAANISLKLTKQASRDAFSYLRLIVSIGWTIYPIGFAIAYIIPGDTIRPHNEGPPFNWLNVIYNIADLINKGAFGLAIWSAAVSDNEDGLNEQPLMG